MTDLEETIINTFEEKPMIWWRYIDDIFFIWEHGEESLEKFLNKLNSFHPTIKFTVEYSKETINFLDVNITYYPVFKNIRNILQKLHLLLAPDKQHKMVYPDVPVVGLRNGKSLKDYLVTAALPKSNETGRCEPCGLRGNF